MKFDFRRTVSYLESVMQIKIHPARSMDNQNETVNADNVSKESYFNLCRLADIFHRPNPIAFLHASGEQWSVTRDASGNILTATAIL